jgi:hypothetical protein
VKSGAYYSEEKHYFFSRKRKDKQMRTFPKGKKYCNCQKVTKGPISKGPTLIIKGPATEGSILIKKYPSLKRTHATKKYTVIRLI